VGGWCPWVIAVSFILRSLFWRESVQQLGAGDALHRLLDATAGGGVSARISGFYNK